MRLLEDRILKEGHALNESVLQVGDFLNHQVDPVLMDELGKDFANHFSDYGITKVFTIESSGIAPALMAASYLGVPMVFLKKNKANTIIGERYHTKVESFTRGGSYDLTLFAGYINPEDRILLIDDFLAYGEAALGVGKLIEQAGACLAGVGIVIEKTFQPGRQRLEEAGYEVYSQARIARLGEGIIEYVKE